MEEIFCCVKEYMSKKVNANFVLCIESICKLLYVMDAGNCLYYQKINKL